MWTYLAILLSASLLFGVFVRRIILYVKGGDEGKKPSPVSAEESDGGSDGDGALGLPPTGKLKKDEVEKAEEFCESGIKKLKRGDEEGAIKDFVQALAVDGLHKETQHRLAMLYMQKQMYSAAAVLFKSLAEITGDSVHYSHLGLALYQQELFEEALSAYQKAVEIDPSRSQRFVSLAQVYRSMEQLQNAVIAMDKAVKIDEENLDYLFLLVDLQMELENYVEAEAVVRKILDIAPERQEAMEYLEEIKKQESMGK